MSQAQIRKRLLSEHFTLSGRLTRLRRELTHDGTNSRDPSELALEQEDDAVLDQLAAKTVTEIRDVDAALVRVAAGTYGLCEHCGEVIEELRLRALPMTTLCIDCARLH